MVLFWDCCHRYCCMQYCLGGAWSSDKMVSICQFVSDCSGDVYSMVEKWVQREDWSALMDVVPGMGKVLWFLVVASIIINGVSLFIKNDRK